MSRCLEFALATAMIVIIESTFAIWVGSLVANRIHDLFNQINNALSLAF